VIPFYGGREKGPSLTPVAAMEPEPEQGASEARGAVLCSAARCAFQHDSQVGMLAFEHGEPGLSSGCIDAVLNPFRESQIVVGMLRQRR
jgi:hypothetical protein